MSRISKRKRIYMCMASVMCMLLLLIPLPVSANDLGSILLKATVEDETTVSGWHISKEFMGFRD